MLTQKHRSAIRGEFEDSFQVNWDQKTYFQGFSNIGIGANTAPNTEFVREQKMESNVNFWNISILRNLLIIN